MQRHPTSVLDSKSGYKRTSHCEQDRRKETDNTEDTKDYTLRQWWKLNLHLLRLQVFSGMVYITIQTQRSTLLRKCA